MRKGKNHILRLVVCAACALSSYEAHGQATLGNISGTVRDRNDAVVVGATVTVRKVDTNAQRMVMTEADGRFRFAGLVVGPYELTVDHTGFARYVRGPIMLLLNQEAVINPVLQIAAATETVTVTDDAPLLNTTSPEVGVRFDEQRLADLPTLPPLGGGGFRDVFAFALSAPGVSQLNSGNQVFATGTNFSTNGARVRSNSFIIDGQGSNDPSSTGREQVLNNPEIVQEFRVITNQLSAEYGGTAGSVVSVVTKSGTNDFHGSAFSFHNDNALNSCSNLDKRVGLTDRRFCSALSGGRGGAPFRIENQIGGTFGGPIRRNRTFFFGSVQRWTDRQQGSGTSISGVPTDMGRMQLQSTIGSRPQVSALLRFLPGAATQDINSSGNPTFATYCLGGTLPACSGGTRVNIPTGTITGSSTSFFNNWQASGRMDHMLSPRHMLGGRYLFSDSDQGGVGQATPPGLTTENASRTQAMSVFLTSNFTPSVLGEFRISWQRLATVTSATDPSAATIPSMEIPELGLTGFAASDSRTAIGLAVNQPQSRNNDTYQLQETIAWTRGPHALKVGIDFRRVDLKSIFLPFIRGRLTYSSNQAGLALSSGTVSIQNFINDVASIAAINKPLPGGQTSRYYGWYDYSFFAQDAWQVHPTLVLSLGLRYEAPGSALASLFPISDAIQSANGGSDVFRFDPRPGRDLNNFQPRLGISWNPKTSGAGLLWFITGRDRLVMRGGYSRTNDYPFMSLVEQVGANSFPFVGSVNSPGLASAFTTLPTLNPDLSNPAGLNRTSTRTILDANYRSPIADQFSVEVQRELGTNTVLRIGYVGTKGTGLFQALDGNPRTLCSAVPIRIDAATGTSVPLGCPRVNPDLGVVRIYANTASSTYHSMQLSLERRFKGGFGAGAHYTWSSFVDTASDIFNTSVRGEVAIAQDSFDRPAERGRSTYDRPQRFTVNAVYELPLSRKQTGVVGRLLGGWQISELLTLQSGTPFGVLNGSDPTAALSGIDSLIGNPIRPNLNTSLPISRMSLQQLRNAGGSSLFNALAPCTRIGTTLTCAPGDRFGDVGRNVLRADGIGNLDLSVSKTTRVRENRVLQFRADFFNLTNTRNFGIPEARITNSGFLDEKSTDGGNRRIFFGLKYSF